MRLLLILSFLFIGACAHKKLMRDCDPLENSYYLCFEP
jgi:hypothetical protein